MNLSNHLIHVDDTVASAEAPPVPAERRRSPRLRTVYRVARVVARGDQGLARIQNISDEGLMFTTSMELCPGDAVQIDLSDECRLTGLVAWYNEGRCGVRLLRHIDSPAVLRQLYEERHSGRGRPLRLTHSKRVVVMSEQGHGAADLRDISQAGLNISHKGNFNPGLAVKVLLAPGMERRGVVRWSKDGLAGIALTEILSVEELGSMRSF
ncbi:PilZ domain-containing protein [Sphingobium sp. 3R8]|uniref:PilZ domain-containing protein n=1 Tax=Sphingobium sp. 3R8 TaxID=2874921 RepID=UPI001CCF6B75|nr:PilZ domain-containing protein [Sphingobium sp. 3R8]MBZ9649240.1 PilZ domain-containing protein [Sphingobium sp. 3R8]